MIPKKMEQAINAQINAELYSAYLYLSMSAHFQTMNLKGFGNWMRVQAMEEFTHADKFATFLLDRGGRVVMGTIDAPPNTWKSALAVFQETSKHEQKVTGLINALVDLSIKEKDHATTNFLQWFVNEQVEEEANAESLAQQLKLIGEAGQGLLMLDRELAQRVFVPPAPGQT
jgi:ferritin